jgi:hypothetical protein
MITSLSAYKAMIEASIGTSAVQRAKSGNDIPSNLDIVGSSAKTDSQSADAVSVDISASSDVFGAVDSYFNLGNSGRFEDYHKLSAEDKQQFMKIVSALASAGYMGYEELVVNNKVERHEILNQVGDQRLHKAWVYDESKDHRR